MKNPTDTLSALIASLLALAETLRPDVILEIVAGVLEIRLTPTDFAATSGQPIPSRITVVPNDGRKIQCIKAARDVTNLGLREAKELTEGAVLDVSPERYARIKAAVEAVGGKVVAVGSEADAENLRRENARLKADEFNARADAGRYRSDLDESNGAQFQLRERIVTLETELKEAREALENERNAKTDKTSAKKTKAA